MIFDIQAPVCIFFIWKLYCTRFCYKVDVYNFFLNVLNICASFTKEDIASEEM